MLIPICGRCADGLAHPDGGLLDVQSPHAMTAVSTPHRHARKRPLSIALMAALFSACTVGRTSCRPNLKPPSIGRPRGSPRTRTARRLVGCLSRSGAQLLIGRGLDANLDLRAAVLRVEEARTQRAVAAAGYWLPYPPTRPTAGNG